MFQKNKLDHTENLRVFFRGGRQGWALSLLEYYLKPTPKWAMKMAAKNSAVPNRRKYRLSLQLHNMGKNQSTHIFRVRLIMKIIAIGNNRKFHITSIFCYGINICASRIDGPDQFPTMLIFSTVAKLCFALPETRFISPRNLKS